MTEVLCEGWIAPRKTTELGSNSNFDPQFERSMERSRLLAIPAPTRSLRLPQTQVRPIVSLLGTGNHGTCSFGSSAFLEFTQEIRGSFTSWSEPTQRGEFGLAEVILSLAPWCERQPERLHPLPAFRSILPLPPLVLRSTLWSWSAHVPNQIP